MWGLRHGVVCVRVRAAAAWGHRVCAAAGLAIAAGAIVVALPALMWLPVAPAVALGSAVGPAMAVAAGVASVVVAGVAAARAVATAPVVGPQRQSRWQAQLWLEL